MTLKSLLLFCVPGIVFFIYSMYRFDWWKTRVLVYVLCGFLGLSYMVGEALAKCNNAFCVDWNADVRDVFTPHGIKID